MICKSRKSKGIIRDNVTEKRFFSKNSFKFRLELSTRILKGINILNGTTFYQKIDNQYKKLILHTLAKSAFCRVSYFNYIN